MAAYYNEFDPYAAQWLRNLITQDLIAPGDVDERSITEVSANDLVGYSQCHFFAGIAGWSLALRLAGWPDDRPVWTGSCPCQPFSSAGKRKGFDDDRHLWPAFARLIAECRPPVIMGEQVASADGLAWIDIVLSDLEATDYACGAVDLCAAGVGAPHIRQRLWWVATNSDSLGVQRHSNTRRPGASRQGWPDSALGLQSILDSPFTPHAGHSQPLLRSGIDGLSARVGRLRAAGNAIVPQVAAEVIAAYMEVPA